MPRSRDKPSSLYSVQNPNAQNPFTKGAKLTVWSVKVTFKSQFTVTSNTYNSRIISSGIIANCVLFAVSSFFKPILVISVSSPTRIICSYFKLICILQKFFVTQKQSEHA